jgi:CRISPR/Cas system Type II protein with McrA/HNH and RuvC-like nuclease domain
LPQCDELRRVVNAVIKQYGKPDVVRIEMARDLEMNTKRYKENEMRQRKNQKANEEAIEVFKQEVGVLSALLRFSPSKHNTLFI